jgi:hypothetical protein
MKPASKLTDALHLLVQADELEGEAHGIWDDACSNLAYANISREARDGYVQRTYEATRKHAAAMEKLRAAVELLRSYR